MWKKRVRNKARVDNPIKVSLDEIEKIRLNLRMEISEGQSSDLLNLMFMTFPQGAVIFKDSDYIILRANPLFCSYLGYSENEIKGMILLAFIYGPDVDRTIQGLIRKDQFSNNADNIFFEFDNRVIAKNGEILWLRWRLYRNNELQVEGILHGFCELISDLNEIQRLSKKHGE